MIVYLDQVEPLEIRKVTLYRLPRCVSASVHIVCIPNGSSIPGPWIVVSVWFSVLQFVLNASMQTEEQKLGCRPGNETTGTLYMGS